MEEITDTFVLVAPDCPLKSAAVPQARGGKPTVASLQYELLAKRPFALTHADLIFEVHVRRAGLSKTEARRRAAEIRAELFKRPQACMRASPLPKQYGFGVHYDSHGRLALYPVESPEYERFAAGKKGVKVVAALRSKRAD